jgi:hypothetical protein
MVAIKKKQSALTLRFFYIVPPNDDRYSEVVRGVGYVYLKDAPLEGIMIKQPTEASCNTSVLEKEVLSTVCNGLFNNSIEKTCSSSHERRRVISLDGTTPCNKKSRQNDLESRMSALTSENSALV